MQLQILPDALTVCKVSAMHDIRLDDSPLFIGKTDEELSLVCRTESAPENALEREDGWRGFRIKGTLDFSLIGILAKISSTLAAHKIGIFVVSTYNTDYVLVKAENLDRAVAALTADGYTFL